MLLLKAEWCFMKRQLQIMVKNIIKIIVRKWYAYVKLLVCPGRRRYALLLPPLILFLLVTWPTLWWSVTWSHRVQETSPARSSQEPSQYNWGLEHYLQNVVYFTDDTIITRSGFGDRVLKKSKELFKFYSQVLIEPTRIVCDTQDKVLVIILVATTSSHFEQREAVRETWGVFQPTIFVMGLDGDRDQQMVENYREATMYNDIMVFEFLDDPLNQTLKTALMMQWTLARCPQALFLFKTEEDVMVNPWMLNKVLWENRNAQVIGYSLTDKHKLAYKLKKDYLNKVVDEGSLKYLSGSGYLIRGSYIKPILNKAYQVPMITLEDVYFTNLVAHKELGLTLTHDRRLSPYKPWLPLSCVYWNQASVHSLAPMEMLHAWYYLEDLAVSYRDSEGICKHFNQWFYSFSDLFLY